MARTVRSSDLCKVFVKVETHACMREDAVLCLRLGIWTFDYCAWKGISVGDFFLEMRFLNDHGMEIKCAMILFALYHLKYVQHVKEGRIVITTQG